MKNSGTMWRAGNDTTEPVDTLGMLFCKWRGG
jgi:hypothetical protein